MTARAGKERIAARRAVLLIFATISSACTAAAPDCTSPDAWPAGMAFTHLKNAALVDNATIDFERTSVARIASERIGRDRYRQVHRVVFFDRSGKAIETITVNDVSEEECSLSDVDVYLVALRLGGQPVAK